MYIFIYLFIPEQCDVEGKIYNLQMKHFKNVCLYHEKTLFFYCLPSSLLFIITLLHTSPCYMEDLHLHINIYENKDIFILMF